MPLSHDFAFPLANGLHARPASHFAEMVARFQGSVRWVNNRTGRAADARSVLGMIATDTRVGDPCRIDVSGADEAHALQALRQYLGDGFLRCDEPLATEASVQAQVLIPRSLAAAGLGQFHAGSIACRGIGEGTVLVAGGFARPPGLASERAESPVVELDKFGRSVLAVTSEIQAAIAKARKLEAGVLSAHLAILKDPALASSVTARIASGLSAGQAVAEAVDEERKILLSAESSYIRERVLDLQDIAMRLWAHLCGTAATAAVPVLDRPSIVFAESLTPSQFLAFDRVHLRGLVLSHGGQTSHAVILARSFGIPTLTGVPVAANPRAGAHAIIDAHTGIVVIDPPATVRAWYARQHAKHARMAAARASRRGEPARSADGRRLEIGANIASVDEATAAFEQGAEGIGLFRTELLFANRPTAPDEEEQYALYSAVAQAAAGRPVIIRTLDVGGDKPVPFLTFPSESNPFLGYRGIRFYEEHAGLVKAQLRAMLRAAVHGPVKILAPMVACVEEARLVRRLLAEARSELAAAGRPHGDRVPLGFMLEVPAVAFIMDELCAEADFFSIGTNDLAQYVHAADRENPKVSTLNDPLQPGFLRLLAQLVSAARARGRWIGLCGELAENTAALPLLLGLGLDEISLAAPRIAATKAALARLDAKRCEQFLQRAAAAATRSDVRQVLASPPFEPVPLLVPELVLDVVAATKEEVIRAIIDELHAAGRTDDPASVEEAVWRREETYSTGFGDGFALPHCQTDVLTANVIAVARLASPVEWNAMDGKPVDLVILLGVRASEHGKAHMETLARLSRLMMRDEFRDSIRRERSREGIVDLLSQATRPLKPAAAV